MTSQATATVSGSTLLLSGVLDYESVIELDKTGRTWLQNCASSKVQVDLAQITYSGSVGLVLLLGWLRCAQELKKTLMILHLPEFMIALAKVGGIEDFLN
jgi:phospholipid transport system transporter-binding protein